MRGGWLRRLESRLAGAAAGGRGSAARLPAVEVVAMPHYLFEWSVRRGERSSAVWIAVGGLDETIRLLQPDALSFDAEEDETPFEAEIGVEEAQGLARAWLRAAVRPAPEVPQSPRSVEVVGYPFWIYYFLRFGRRIDLRMLDALTGRPVGSKVVAGFLRGLERSPPRAGRCTPAGPDL